MISKVLAAKHVARMAQLQGFPRDEREAREELVSALQLCKTETQADTVVNEWVRAFPVLPCPKPGELRKRIYDDDHTAQLRREGCERCGGLAFISGLFLITNEPKEGGGRRYTKQIISEEQAKELRPKLGRWQEIMWGSTVCGCHAPIPAEYAT